MRTKQISARLAKAFVIVATTLGLTVGVAAIPAQAAVNMTLIFGIGPRSGDYWTVAVRGLVPMSQADAQASINRGGYMSVSLYGEDPGSDQFRINYKNASLTAVPEGLRYDATRQVHRDRLNEDDNLFDNDDEIYATVLYIDQVVGSRSLRSGTKSLVA